MLDVSELYRALPHDGNMCLLDSVLRWDTESIVCAASGHRDPRNPLHIGNSLPVLCGLEYAAQALALHGVLIIGKQPADALINEQIFVVSVKGVTCYADRLDAAVSDLEITGALVFNQQAAAVYDFAVNADGDVLIDGQLGLMSPPR